MGATARESTATEKTAVLAIGNLIAKMGTFATGVILVRYLAPSDYGMYRTVLLIQGTLLPFFLLGLPTAVYYFLSTVPRENLRAYLASTRKTLGVAALIFSIVLFGLSFFTQQLWHQSELASPLRLFSLYPLAAVPVTYFYPMLVTLNRHRHAAVYNLFQAGLYIVSMALVLLVAPSVHGVLLATVLAEAVRFVVVEVYTLRLVRTLPYTPDPALLWRQFRYSLPIGLSNLVGVVGRSMDKLLIAFLFPAATYAVYSVGSMEIPVLDVLTSAISSVLLVEFAASVNKNDFSRGLSLLRESVRKSALIIAPIFSFSLVFAKWLIPLLFTGSYSGSTVIFQVGLLTLPLRVTQFSLILQAVGDTRTVFKGAAWFTLLNTVGGILSLRVLGLYGPMVSNVVMTYWLGWYYLRGSSRALSLPFSHIVPFSAVARIFALGLIAGVCSLPALLINGPVIVRLFVAGCVYMMAYGGGALALRVISRADLDRVWAGLLRKR